MSNKIKSEAAERLFNALSECPVTGLTPWDFMQSLEVSHKALLQAQIVWHDMPTCLALGIYMASASGMRQELLPNASDRDTVSRIVRTIRERIAAGCLHHGPSAALQGHLEVMWVSENPDQEPDDDELADEAPEDEGGDER